MKRRVRVTNTSAYPTAEVRAIVRFVARMLDLPEGARVVIEPFPHARSFVWRGIAYRWHCTVRIVSGRIDWERFLVRGVAHELRHCDQYQGRHHKSSVREEERDARRFSDLALAAWDQTVYAKGAER